MIYFRRPQTAFVDAEILQKPQSQWKLVAEGKEDDEVVLGASEPSPGSGGLDGSNGSLDGSGGLNGSRRGSVNSNGSASLLEEDPTKPLHDSDHEKDEDPPKDPLAPPETDESSNNDNNEDDETTELAQNLEKRLQLEVKNHPESVLLCGYFHEEVIEDWLALSTYLPGVEARELRVYYGEGVLKIAGARALYNFVQRFERSFALDERLVDSSRIAALLHDGVLMVRVPLAPMPPPPVRIKVVEATPMILFKDRSNKFCLDIDVPGVKLNDLRVFYNNGVLRLEWERLEPSSDNAITAGESNTSNSLNTKSKLKQMRFEREIPINTLQINTEKFKAYLDLHSKLTGVLTITAPLKFKRTTRPIQVRTAKDLKLAESGDESGM